MNDDMYSWGSDLLADGPSSEVVDHWLDEALRAVPLPDGFFARMCTLADAVADRTDGRDGAKQSASRRFEPFTPNPSDVSRRGRHLR